MILKNGNPNKYNMNSDDEDEEQMPKMKWYYPFHIIERSQNMRRKIQSMCTNARRRDENQYDDYIDDPFLQIKADAWDAIDHNDVNQIELYMQNGNDYINEKWALHQGDIKCTMMMKASECGALDVMKFLVRSGADIHVRDEVGEQAIHYATRFCQPQAVSLLLRCGADESSSNVRGSQGLTPLHLTCSNLESNVQTSKVLTVMKILLDAGANVNAKDVCVTYTTPLQMVVHGAVAPDQIGTVQLNKMSSNGKHSNRVTKQIIEAVHMLINSGANVNEADQFNGGCTLLHQSLGDCNSSMVRLLISCGARTDIPNDLNETAIHFAMHLDACQKTHFWVDLLMNPSNNRPHLANAAPFTHQLSSLGMHNENSVPLGIFQRELDNVF